MERNKVYFSTKKPFPVSIEDIDCAIRSHLKKRGKGDSFLELSIVGKSKMRSLNKKFLNHDYPTDVLSFPQSQYPSTPSKKNFIGAIVICSDIIDSQAKKNLVSFEEEFFFYLFHGIDHLLGIHHK
jgi:probable rRNA maturation factor